MEGRTPEAKCQWWLDRLSSHQAGWGSAGAPEAESSGERFLSWSAARLQRSSSWKRIPVPLPKEDYSVLAYCHVPLCCWGLTNPVGSRANGAADLPYPSIITSAQHSPGWMGNGLEDGGGGHWRGAGPLLPPTSLPQRWQGHQYPCTGREWQGQQALAGWQAESGRCQAGKESLRQG